MNPTDDAMVTIGGGEQPPTAEVELERTTVTAEQVRRFLHNAAPGQEPPQAPATAPLSFALVLRRGHGPEATISPRAFAIHGGHDIQLTAPIVVGETYVVTGRVERVFAKTGRSGPLTIVERRVWIRDPRGRPAVELTDRQIVRWRPATPDPGSQPAVTSSLESPLPEALRSPAAVPTLEIGDRLGPFRRRGPSGAEISRWADTLRDREVLFHDRGSARELGYDDLVVPGPMQSAFVDCWLAACACGWRATGLHMTFRQSLLAGDQLSIEGVVVDGDADERSLDVLIRNAASGEVTSTGTIVLGRAIS